MATPTIVSLCSGIAGLDLGVRRALGAARTVLYVERELTAARVVEAQIAAGRLDDAPIWSDLGTLDGTAWRGLVDGVVAGIPCQPHSVAGKGLGADDPRDLWPVTARLLRDIEPGWFLLENVPGILRYYHDRIRPELHAMGYRVAEALVTAAEVGAPHRRERLFVLAHRTGSRFGRRQDAGAGGGDEGAYGSGSIEPQRDSPLLADRASARVRRQHERPRDGLGEEFDADGRGAELVAPRGGVVGDTDIAGLEGRQQPEQCGRHRLPTWPDGSPMGFPPGPDDRDAWAAVLARWPHLAPATQSPVRDLAPGLPDMLAGLSRADKLRMLGNAVVPAAAEYAMRLLIEDLGL